MQNHVHMTDRGSPASGEQPFAPTKKLYDLMTLSSR